MMERSSNLDLVPFFRTRFTGISDKDILLLRLFNISITKGILTISQKNCYDRFFNQLTAFIDFLNIERKNYNLNIFEFYSNMFKYICLFMHKSTKYDFDFHTKHENNAIVIIVIFIKLNDTIYKYTCDGKNKELKIMDIKYLISDVKFLNLSPILKETKTLFNNFNYKDFRVQELKILNEKEVLILFHSSKKSRLIIMLLNDEGKRKINILNTEHFYYNFLNIQTEGERKIIFLSHFSNRKISNVPLVVYFEMGNKSNKFNYIFGNYYYISIYRNKRYEYCFESKRIKYLLRDNDLEEENSKNTMLKLSLYKRIKGFDNINTIIKLVDLTNIQLLTISDEMFVIYKKSFVWNEKNHYMILNKNFRDFVYNMLYIFNRLYNIKDSNKKELPYLTLSLRLYLISICFDFAKI